ncbi:GFA family protein [Shewanella sp. SR44-3]|uniref:GFA family protein n=1 Tax=Shewanella sp. SR44-3 TaxID=2760936 RepID=UPI001C71FC50|nr:GFA family protein [Shewanella sp. SR44-3]
MHKGNCLCGKVNFTVKEKLAATDVCHCTQYRKWTGHQFANVEVSREALFINGEQHLKWLHSSDKVRRGFCCDCGSSLFFAPIDKQPHQWIGIALAHLTPQRAPVSSCIFLLPKRR